MGALFFRKTLRDLRASLAQTVALVVIVALGIASLMALIGAYRDLGRSYQHTYSELHFADAAFDVQSAPQSVVDEIGGIEGVAGVTGRLVVDTGITVPSDAATDPSRVASTTGSGSAGVQPNGPGTREVRSRLIGIPAATRPAVDDVAVTQGSYFSPNGAADDANSPGEALLESHFAGVYGYRPGDTVNPLVDGVATPLRVSGIVASPEYLIVSASRQDIVPSAREFGVLFVPLPLLQKLTGQDGEVNNLVVTFAAGAVPEKVISAVKGVLAPFGVISVTTRKDQPSASALKLDLDGYQQIGYMMPALILLAAAASLFVMLGRQIRSQRTQIGLMKALGHTRASVTAHFLTTSLIISLLGAALGVAAGYPLGHEITTGYAAELGIPLVTSSFYPDLAITGVALSVLVSILAGVAPALRAASLPPASAMRPDPAAAAARGKRSLFDRLFPLPVRWRLPARNVFRNPIRSISTLVGVLFAFVLVLSALSMTDSMNYVLDNNFNRVERWDVSASFNTPQSPAVLQRIRSIRGVAVAEPRLDLPATVRQASDAASATGASGTATSAAAASAPAASAATPATSSASVQIVLTAIAPDSTLHRIDIVKGSDAATALNGDGSAGGTNAGIVMTTTAAAKIHASVGDVVRVETPLGSHDLTVRALAQELMGSVAYVSLAEAQSWVPFHLKVFDGVYIRSLPGSASDVRASLYHLPGAASVTLKSAMRGSWESLMGLYYAIMGAVLVFALAMAFALLFNAMTVNVLEQQREFATMRSIGTGRRTVTAVMTIENVLLWLVALVPGLVLGKLAAEGMLNELNSDLFSIVPYISPVSYIATSLGILGTMILATLPAVRRVNRLNLAVATKVLS